MKSTTPATSRKKRRAITAATWPSCARRRRMRAWCSAPRRPVSKAASTPRRASTRCSNFPTALPSGRCRTCRSSTCAQEFLETRKHAIFSRALIEAIRERLANNEQAMMLLNRRGFSTFVACRSCGERVQCINCSVTLTYHRRDRRLLCHYCGYAEKIPSVCPKVPERAHPFHGLGIGARRR